MSTVISVEHLSKTSLRLRFAKHPRGAGRVFDYVALRAYHLGQIGTPSESTRPLASLGMLREGELPGPSRADLEVWWAKARGAWRPTPCSALAHTGCGIILSSEKRLDMLKPAKLSESGERK